uniref:Uncharacterized protein n=1 Tax=Oryctolagus cuniculus TaxID=9986 RepID=G1T7Q0_RABIT
MGRCGDARPIIPTHPGFFAVGGWQRCCSVAAARPGGPRAPRGSGSQKLRASCCGPRGSLSSRVRKVCGARARINRLSRSALPAPRSPQPAAAAAPPSRTPPATPAMSYTQFGYPYSSAPQFLMAANSLSACCESGGRTLAEPGPAASAQAPVYCPVYESRLLATARHELNSAAALWRLRRPLRGAHRATANYVTYGSDASAFYSLVRGAPHPRCLAPGRGPGVPGHCAFRVGLARGDGQAGLACRTPSLPWGSSLGPRRGLPRAMRSPP